MRHYLERIERDYPHVYGILNNKQRRRNVKVLAPEASATSVLTREMRVLYSVYSQSAREVCIRFCVFRFQACMRHYSKRLSRVCACVNVKRV